MPNGNIGNRTVDGGGLGTAKCPLSEHLSRHRTAVQLRATIHAHFANGTRLARSNYRWRVARFAESSAPCAWQRSRRSSLPTCSSSSARTFTTKHGPQPATPPNPTGATSSTRRIVVSLDRAADAVLFHLRVEVRASDAELPRGLRPVAGRPHQRALDHPPLQRRQRIAQQQTLVGRLRDMPVALVADLLGKASHVDHLAAGERGGPLDDVDDFPYVARPAVA